MDSLVFSQQYLNPLPRHYQGNDPKELAYQLFVDWKDMHPSGEILEFLAVMQAANHAAHWLQADIAEHFKLKSTLRALNTTIMSKHEWLEIQRIFCSKPSSTDARPFENAAIKNYNMQISKLRASLTAIKRNIRAIKEERYRSPLVEQVYRTLLSGRDLFHAESQNNNLCALRILAWAVEKLTCAIYLSLEAENEAYLANMCRLSHALAPKVARLIALEKRRQRATSEPVLTSFVKKLIYGQGLLERLIEGRKGDLEAPVPNPKDGPEVGAEHDHGDDEYLGRIVRYWSRWDREGYAYRDFKLIWSFVSQRECVVWQR